MNETYLSTFGLTNPPFSKEIGDADLWLPESRKTVVDELVEAIEERQSVMLSGDAGVGKTCVLRALRHRLPRDRVRLTYCHNPTLGRRDFYRQLCLALGLTPKATAASLFYGISTHIHELSTTRVHPVFILDEAHMLHPDVLAHLHILLNYEWDSKALLSIVLVGLPELEDRLSFSTQRPLLSRIHRRLRVGPLGVDDTGEYVRHRLELAGCQRELFPVDALGLLHEASGGQHRDLDRLAALALRETARRRRKLVDRDIVEAVIDRDSRAAA